MTLLPITQCNRPFASPGQQLLQDVYHVDQPEDQEDVRGAQHVRVQAHQAVRQVVHGQPGPDGGVRVARHAARRPLAQHLQTLGAGR